MCPVHRRQMASSSTHIGDVGKELLQLKSLHFNGILTTSEFLRMSQDVTATNEANIVCPGAGVAARATIQSSAAGVVMMTKRLSARMATWPSVLRPFPRFLALVNHQSAALELIIAARSQSLPTQAPSLPVVTSHHLTSCNGNTTVHKEDEAGAEPDNTRDGEGGSDTCIFDRRVSRGELCC